MRLRLAFKIMTSCFTFDGRRKKVSYWQKEVCKGCTEKQDARVAIAKRKIEKYYFHDERI